MNTAADLVSVIVPFLNGGIWLMEALQSVLAQTYKNWELIVIDDGSQAFHTRLAKEFCSRYPGKILYTEHEGHRNKGVSASRNKAAEYAKGKYIAFLDADDKWLPQKLEVQLSYLQKYPQAAMACEGIIKWYSWNDAEAEDHVHPVGVPAGSCYQPGELTKLLYPLTEAASPAPSGFLIRKDAFERIGGFEAGYNGIYELYEDQAFLAKLYLSETVYVAGTANVMYRKREGSMCAAASDTERYNLVRLYFFDWLESYMTHHLVHDNEIMYLLQKAKHASLPVPILSAV